MNSFFLGFADELVKLAQRRPGETVPEASPEPPKPPKPAPIAKPKPIAPKKPAMGTQKQEEEKFFGVQKGTEAQAKKNIAAGQAQEAKYKAQQKAEEERLRKAREEYDKPYAEY